MIPMSAWRTVQLTLRARKKKTEGEDAEAVKLKTSDPAIAIVSA